MTLASSPRALAALATALGALAASGCGTDDPAAEADAGSTAPTTTHAAPAVSELASVEGGTFTLQPVLFPTSTSRDQVHLAPIAPATGNERRVKMPITGGKVAPKDARRGSFTVDGGFRITGGHEPVEVKSLFVDTTTGDIFGLLDGTRTRVLHLDRADLRPDRRGAQLLLDGVQLRLEPPLSEALNDAFGVTTFPAGMPFGQFEARLMTG